MFSGSALTYKQERSASDLCRWYHTNLLKLWVLMSSFQKQQVYTDLGTVFPSPHKPRAAQGKWPAVGYLDLPTWKEEVSKAASPNLVAMPAPLH